MRFMMMVKSSPELQEGRLPDVELMEAMGRFNEEMAKAGVLISGEGLHPSAQGARVRFSGGKPTLIDGPFVETKEMIGGFWIIEVALKEEAIQWAMKSPAPFGPNEPSEIEIRRVYETEDFLAVPDAAEVVAKEQSLRAELAKKNTK